MCLHFSYFLILQIWQSKYSKNESLRGDKTSTLGYLPGKQMSCYALKRQKKRNNNKKKKYKIDRRIFKVHNGNMLDEIHIQN